MAKTNEQLEEMGKYYIENDVTYEEAANHFGVSKRSFQLYMKKLKEISSTTYKLVQDKKIKNLEIGAKKGGSISKHESINVGRKRHISDEQLENYTNKLIEGDLSLRQLQADTGIPKSTLHDNLTNRISNEATKQKLEELFEEHKPENNKKGRK